MYRNTVCFVQRLRALYRAFRNIVFNNNASAFVLDRYVLLGFINTIYK